MYSITLHYHPHPNIHNQPPPPQKKNPTYPMYELFAHSLSPHPKLIKTSYLSNNRLVTGPTHTLSLSGDPLTLHVLM